MVLTRVSIPRESPNRTLPLANALRITSESPSLMALALLKLLLLCWVLGKWVSTMSTLRVESPSPTALWLSWTYAMLVFKTRHFGGSSLQYMCLTHDTKPWLLREESHICAIPPSYGSRCWGYGFGKTVSLPLLPISMWPFYP